MGGVCLSGNSNEGMIDMKSSVSGIAKGGQASDLDKAALAALQGRINCDTRDELKERTMLSFSLRDLPSWDSFSKSDPFIVMYQMVRQGKRIMRKVVGKSEVQWNKVNPDFVKQIEIDYFFEEVQNIRVEAYDCDDKDKM